MLVPHGATRQPRELRQSGPFAFAQHCGAVLHSALIFSFLFASQTLVYDSGRWETHPKESQKDEGSPVLAACAPLCMSLGAEEARPAPLPLLCPTGSDTRVVLHRGKCFQSTWPLLIICGDHRIAAALLGQAEAWLKAATRRHCTLHVP